MKTSKEDIDPFDRMEKILKELYGHAINYNVRDINSVENFRQFRNHGEAVRMTLIMI